MRSLQILIFSTLLFFFSPSGFCQSVLGTSTDSQVTDSGLATRVIWDSTHNLFWSWYTDGSNINWNSSEDGISWYSTIPMPFSSHDFDVASYESNDVTYFVPVFVDGYDIKIGAASYSGFSYSATLGGTIVFDGSVSDSYSHPSVAIDNDGIVWIAAIRSNSSGQSVVVTSTADPLTEAYVINAPTTLQANSFLISGVKLFKKGGSNMAAMVYETGELMRSYYYNGSWNDPESNAAYRRAWTSLSNGANGSVIHAVSSGSLGTFVSGDFTTIGGVSAAHIARWNGSTWEALGSGLSGGSSTAYKMLQYGDSLYVAGSFTSAGGATGTNYVARWDGSAWHSLGISMTNVVWDMAIADGYLYLAGTYTNADGIAEADYISKYNLTSGTLSALSASILNSPVYAVAVRDSAVYVGGLFSQAGLLTVNRIAKYDGSWHALGAGTVGVSGGDVYSIAVNEAGTVFVGGNFTAAGGVANTNAIAAFDGSWKAVASGLNNAVYRLGWLDDALIVAGYFTDATSDTASDYLLMWNGTSFVPIGAGLSGAVEDFSIYASNFYAVGVFDTSGATNLNHVAAASTTCWPYAAGQAAAVGDDGSYQFVLYTDAASNLCYEMLQTSGTRISSRAPVLVKANAADPQISLVTSNAIFTNYTAYYRSLSDNKYKALRASSPGSSWVAASPMDLGLEATDQHLSVSAKEEGYGIFTRSNGANYQVLGIHSPAFRYISGSVTYAGDPVDGAVVSLIGPLVTKSAVPSYTPAVAQATTTAGSYQLKPTGRGVYQISTTAQGYETSPSYRIVQIAGADQGNINFTLAENTPTPTPTPTATATPTPTATPGNAAPVVVAKALTGKINKSVNLKWTTTDDGPLTSEQIQVKLKNKVLKKINTPFTWNGTKKKAFSTKKLKKGSYTYCVKATDMHRLSGASSCVKLTLK